MFKKFETVKVYEVGNLTKAEAQKQLVKLTHIYNAGKFGHIKVPEKTLEDWRKRAEKLSKYIDSIK